LSFQNTTTIEWKYLCWQTSS